MGVRLPPEYQEVEYLESTGVEYIDTEIIADDTTGFFVDGRKKIGTATDDVIIGSRSGSNSRFWADIGRSGAYNNRFLLGWNGYHNTNINIGTNRFSISVNYNNDRKVYVNEVENEVGTNALTTSLYVQTVSIYLFAANNQGSVSNAINGQIFACRITRGSVLLADFIPCYRKSDSKPGMYDLVSGTFFVNQGTGEFAVGNDVIDSISPWLVARRRSLMKPIPDGYVKNGLVFFLDGTQKLDADSWTDIISGKKFDLKNCTLGTNGVVFNGSTSYAERSGLVSRDWSNETIEVCMSGGNLTSSSGIFVFAQPFIDSVGISFRCGYHTTNRGRAGIGLDDATRAYPVFNSSGVKTFSACDRVAVVNGVLSSYGNHSTSYGKNLMGKTFIGAGPTVNNDGLRLFFRGTIYAIRIYNRKLSVAEMQANQQADASRYGLSI